MKLKSFHPNFRMPARGSETAGAFDIFMPTHGQVSAEPKKFNLGFATEIPPGYVAQLLPRSGVGSKGLRVVNTIGVIDADYRGEWMAVLENPLGTTSWFEGDRILQFLLVPVGTPQLVLVDSLEETQRGSGGFGSSGI